jgi:hypothetical protein
MKQYCRYCIHLAYGNGTWCEVHEKEMADSTAKRVNTCKDFEFCEIDAFGENLDGYHPREAYRKHEAQELQGEQMKIDLEADDD